jgi:hypothetical protein
MRIIAERLRNLGEVCVALLDMAAERMAPMIGAAAVDWPQISRQSPVGAYASADLLGNKEQRAAILENLHTIFAKVAHGQQIVVINHDPEFQQGHNFGQVARDRFAEFSPAGSIIVPASSVCAHFRTAYPAAQIAHPISGQTFYLDPHEHSHHNIYGLIGVLQTNPGLVHRILSDRWAVEVCGRLPDGMQLWAEKASDGLSLSLLK